jgi:hypothetical protein
MLTRWAAWPRGIRWLVGGVAAVVLVLAIAWVLFVPAADWLAHHDVGSVKGQPLQAARDGARGRLLTLGAGLLAAGALLFTARNFTLSRRTFQLTEQSQVTDRYTKAIEQLGSGALETMLVRNVGAPPENEPQERRPCWRKTHPSEPHHGRSQRRGSQGRMAHRRRSHPGEPYGCGSHQRRSPGGDPISCAPQQREPVRREPVRRALVVGRGSSGRLAARRRRGPLEGCLTVEISFGLFTCISACTAGHGEGLLA